MKNKITLLAIAMCVFIGVSAGHVANLFLNIPRVEKREAKQKEIKYVYVVFETYNGYTNSSGDYVPAKHILMAWSFKVDVKVTEEQIQKYLDENVIGLVETETTTFKGRILKCEDGNCIEEYNKVSDEAKKRYPDVKINDLKYITVDIQ